MNPRATATSVPPLHLDTWPDNGLEAVLHCPACGHEQTETLHQGLTDRVFLTAPGQWTLKRCRRCRCAYLNPRPTAATIHLAYQRYYTHTATPVTRAEKLSPLQRYFRAAANGYRNRRYNSQLQPASPWGGLLLSRLPRYRHRLDRELRYLPPVWPGASLLDVGFGSGTFMARAQSLGWAVTGVDPDPKTVNNARQRGLDVYHGGIEVLAQKKGKAHFDVITLSHVIEHVHAPGEVLASAYRLLKPGGQLYLETPNIEALGHQHYGQYWRGLEPPRHLTLFTWPALEALLQRSGFAAPKRVIQTRVYPTLAAKSRALREGKDPYQAARVTFKDRLNGLAADVKSRQDHRQAEFITLLAYKPR